MRLVVREARRDTTRSKLEVSLVSSLPQLPHLELHLEPRFYECTSSWRWKLKLLRHSIGIICGKLSSAGSEIHDIQLT